MISGLRVYFGTGFIGAKEQLIKEVIILTPKPILKVPSRTDVNVIRDKKEFSKDKPDSAVKSYYDQYQGVLEYAVSGWT